MHMGHIATEWVSYLVIMGAGSIADVGHTPEQLSSLPPQDLNGAAAERPPSTPLFK